MQKCAISGDRPATGLASVYWAWFTIDHEREARKVQYCLACFTDEVLPFVTKALQTPPEDVYDNCLDCGVGIGDLGAVIYATIYPPKSNEIKVDLWFCFPCFDKMRHTLGSLGDRLPDRSANTRAPARSPWAELALEPLAS